METGDYRGTVVDKLPHLLSTKNSRRCLPPDFLLSSAVVRSPRCIFSWRDAAQRCGRHDKNDPLFGGFSSLRLLKIGISPGRKKVSQGKPTEKWVVFIKTGKPCRPSSIQVPPAGKGSPHDSAWIVLLCARGPLNLSKALLFGSTFAGGCPFASFPSLEQGMEVCSVHPPERRPPADLLSGRLHFP